MSGILSHTPAYILRTRIINSGHGTPSAENRSWPVYVDGEPNTPDNVITIRDTTNRDVGYNQYRKEMQEYHGVQVRIRAKDIPTGFPKFNALCQVLERYIHDTLIVGDITYTITSYVVSTTHLGREIAVSRRMLWTINAMLDLHQITPTPVPTP